MEPTQEEKIITYMLYQVENKDWFFPPDFMKNTLGDLFVGYEASARLSELAKAYPEMIESRRNGKYVERRIRYENIANFFPLLSTQLRHIFHRRQITPETISKVKFYKPTLFSN